MIASDDDQQFWAVQGNKNLVFLGLAGFRPIIATVLVSITLVASATWDAFPAFLVAFGAVGIFLCFPADRYFRSSLVRDPDVASPLATFVVARSGLAFSALLVGSTNQPAISALAALLLALAIELALRTCLERLLPVARNLPGIREVKVMPVSAGLGPFLYLSTVAQLAIAVYVPWLSWLAFTTALLNLVFISTYLILVVVGIRTRQRTSKELTSALEAYKPRFVLHWKAPAGTAYQIEMWLPYLERMGLDFFVLVRDARNFAEACALTNRPVVLRETLSSLDSVVVPSLKAALYVNTATLNNHFVRYRQMTHIQLNHGDSDKAPSYNAAFRAFDRNFVAGQAAIDRFSDNGVSTAPDFFEVVGRPQTSTIIRMDRERSAPTRCVLYTPTWHGFYADTDYSSLMHADIIITQLLSVGARVIFRPHPYSMLSELHMATCQRINSRLEADSDLHIFGEEAMSADLFSLFNVSDMMISDVSSVVTDYLVSEKPILIISNPQSRHLVGKLGHACYVFDLDDGPDSLMELLLQAISDDPLLEPRLEMKTYYVGFEGSSEFEKQLSSYLI